MCTWVSLTRARRLSTTRGQIRTTNRSKVPTENVKPIDPKTTHQKAVGCSSNPLQQRQSPVHSQPCQRGSQDKIFTRHSQILKLLEQQPKKKNLKRKANHRQYSSFNKCTNDSDNYLGRFMPKYPATSAALEISKPNIIRKHNVKTIQAALIESNEYKTLHTGLENNNYILSVNAHNAWKETEHYTASDRVPKLRSKSI